ncbi:hypothetical protein HUG10_19490 (plasmid) [Halorarum halophilum]|uniref:Halobacterial output domain-containing protein n=1 Tax=Halorarum halophilum TaxID=2743090 RepID=A0A7D5GP90_9EURY|nr:HalOD1 output domain-containing protein [Halobaculum halophilum]QLG29787.1 hypothetical protein HUG10_19490 [Halobaculum halophilum]
MTPTNTIGSAEAGSNEGSVVHRDGVARRDESICEAVVSAVGEALGKDPTAVEPLNTAVDPDALESLFDVRYGGEARTGDGHVSFRLDGCDVTVYGDQQVVVRR